MTCDFKKRGSGKHGATEITGDRMVAAFSSNGDMVCPGDTGCKKIDNYAFILWQKNGKRKKKHDKQFSLPNM